MSVAAVNVSAVVSQLSVLRCRLIVGFGCSPRSAAGLKVKGINHISLQVSDLQRSREFYSKLFAATVNPNPRPEIELRLDFGDDAYFVLRRAGQPGQLDHLAMRLEGFDKARVTQQLKDSGIMPVDVPNVAGSPAFHVVDPDGFKVQLV
jgi:catechol 2,3-dioxygenase-like lactoylglutathione lyase family enzyme